MSTKAFIRILIFPLITVALFFFGAQFGDTAKIITPQSTNNTEYVPLLCKSASPFDQPCKTHADEEITSIQDERTDDDVETLGLCHVFQGIVHLSHEEAPQFAKHIEYRAAFHVIPVYILYHTLII